ncbi:MAG: hypothetical protein ACK5HP_02570 [Bacilli bacterium]
MFTIKENIISEIIINKSRFITKLLFINNDLEVKQIIDFIKT